VSVLLGLLIAWFILNFTSVGRSNYANTKLLPENIESSDNQNSSLIGTGLASRAPAPVILPSVMDATPASSAQPVMMGSMNMAPISVMQTGATQMGMPMQGVSGRVPMPMQTGAAQMPMQTGAGPGAMPPVIPLVQPM